MVRKTVRFVFSQNPLRGRFFSLNEPLKKFFFEKLRNAHLEHFEVEKLPTFFSQNLIFCP